MAQACRLQAKAKNLSPNGRPCTTLPEANRAEGNVGGARAAARGASSPADN